MKFILMHFLISLTNKNMIWRYKL